MNLAAKYRPQSFSDMTEQTAVVDILKKICSDSELPNRNFLLIGPAGTGKAQPLYSKVLTPAGFIQMKDVKIGTEVIDGDGARTAVTGVYPQGKRMCYDIKFDDGSYIRVADNHLNSVTECNLNTETIEDKVLTTLDLIESMHEGGAVYFVSLQGRHHEFVECPSFIHPYLLGVFAANGAIVDDDVVFSCIPVQAVMKLNSILENDWLCKLKFIGRDDGPYRFKVVPLEGSDTENVQCLIREFRTYMPELFEIPRRLPEYCIGGSESYREFVLDGLSADFISDYNTFETDNKILSDQFTEIANSLGQIDYVDESDYFPEITMYIHRTLPAMQSSRKIIAIEEVGEVECQCIMVDSDSHTYVTDNYTVTHNTTLGRIISKQLNDGNTSGVIEIDAASHGSADAARDITAQSRAYPVGSKWKVFIIDECVTGETEILTFEGWKRIDSIEETDKIAQYTEYGNIEFVDNWEYVKKEYEGEMYDVAFRNGKRVARMSPHHVQPVRMCKSRKLRENYIQDCKFSQSNEIIVSGKGTGNNDRLSPLDRLYIACQADGYCNKNYKETYWELHLVLQEKIDRIKELLEACSIPYRVFKNHQGGNDTSITFYYDFPRDKKLSSYFDLDMGVDRAQDFIAEILRWDGSTKSGYPGYYSCTDKDNVDFVSAVLTLCGYSGTVNVDLSKNPNHKDVWSVNWFYTDARTGQAVSKTKVENFKGLIYCVKVPSKMIILRAQGFSFVSGNCHSISSQGWQVLLKTLEESPAKSIFVLCTTNPEKIPATILSRVQTFRLSKISIEGISKRLKHICDCEISEGVDLKYEEEALTYIAKLGNGGMRDSIQLLDRAIAYNSEITVKNLAIALDLPNYDTYFRLLNGIAKKDNSAIVKIINDVYDSGTNFVVWFEGFHSFVCQIVKYIYLQDINQTMIPSYYQDKISGYGSTHVIICLRLANKLLTLNHALKTTNYLQEVAITHLCFSEKR